MRLLVSVRNPHEAVSALGGGADIIDAKDPAGGALGAVSAEMFGSIIECVGGRVPVSAALGDAGDGGALDERVHAFARAGAAFVKVGFAGLDRRDVVTAMIATACREAAGTGTGTVVVAVAYADYGTAHTLSPDLIAEAAAIGGARGVLLDTAAKDGPGLLQLVAERQLLRWVHRAQSAGLFVALAGQLRATDLRAIAACGADIVGVRGAACEGGRAGTINVECVQGLSTTLRARTGSMRPSAGAVAGLGRSSYPPAPVPTRRQT
jgi:uncharacterized protein (UPF0264 family)